MKKIISLLVFTLIFGTVYSYNDPTNTSSKKKDASTEVVFELEDESYVNDIPFNTTKVFAEHYLRKIGYNQPIDTLETKLKCLDIENKSFDGHWGGFGLGVNSFTTDLPEDYGFMDLNLKKSINVQLNLVEVNMNIIKENVGIVSGLGLEYSNYRFDDNVVLEMGDKNIINGIDDKNYNKSKLVVNYLNLPLLLEYQTNNKDNKNSFHITTGLVGGMRIGTHTKMVYNDGGKEKDKVKDDFYTNPFKLDATVRMGWSKLNLYSTYSLIPLFKDNKGPEVYPFVIGISLSSW